MVINQAHIYINGDKPNIYNILTRNNDGMMPKCFIKRFVHYI